VITIGKRSASTKRRLITESTRVYLSTNDDFKRKFSLSDTGRVPTFSYLPSHVNFRTHVKLDSFRSAKRRYFRRKIHRREIKAVKEIKRENLACALHRVGRFYPFVRLSNKKNAGMYDVTCDKCALRSQHLTIVKLCLAYPKFREKFYCAI